MSYGSNSVVNASFSPRKERIETANYNKNKAGFVKKIITEFSFKKEFETAIQSSPPPHIINKKM